MGVSAGTGAAGSAADADGSMLVRTTGDGDLVWRRTYGTTALLDLRRVGERVTVTGTGDARARDRERLVRTVVDR